MGNNIKKILVTGGAGFIGSNLANKLTRKGFEVVILDSLSKQIHGENPEIESPLYNSVLSNNNVRFIKGSVTSLNDWFNALNDIDAVVHLAAETGTGQSMYEIDKYVDVNIRGTALLLQLLANNKHSIKKIILSSSRAVYGEGRYKCNIHGIVYPKERNDFDMKKGDFECKCPICNGTIENIATSEDSKISPTSIYGITKQNQEQLVQTVCKAIGLDSVCLRFQNVYGPGQSLSNPYTGILSIFSTQIKNGNDINIFEDGNESRDFVYIDDIVESIILAIGYNEHGNFTFNVGTGVPINVKTVANTLKNYYASDINILITGNYRLGDIRHHYADISRAIHILGYHPIINFNEGILRFCRWVNSQAIQKDKYTESINEMKSKGLYK